jgi:hypothetical protein
MGWRNVVEIQCKDLTKHVSLPHLRDPDWDSCKFSTADLQKLSDLQEDVERECHTWRHKGAPLDHWDGIGSEQARWTHAGT